MKFKEIFHFSFFRLIIFLILLFTGLAGMGSGHCVQLVGLSGSCPSAPTLAPVYNIYGWIILFPAALIIMMAHNSTSAVIGFILFILIFILNSIWLMFLSGLIDILIKKIFKKK